MDGRVDEIPDFYENSAPSELIAGGVQCEGWYSIPGEKDRYIVFNAAPVKNVDGKIIAVIQTLENLTERRLGEEKIGQLSQIVEQSPLSIVMTDLKGDIQYVNTRFSKMTGFSFEDVAGKNPRVLGSDTNQAVSFKNLWETVQTGDVWRGILRNRKKNGELFWEAENVNPLRNSQGVTTHYIAFKEDITERVEREGHMDALWQVSEALRPAQGIDEMYAIIVEHIIELVQLDNACLLRRSDISDEIDIVLSRGDCPCNEPFFSELIKQVFEEGTTYSRSGLPDAQQDPAEDGLGAILISPLKAYGETNCVVCVLKKPGLSELEIDSLQFVLGIASSAIHRTQLHDSLQKQVKHLSALRTIEVAIAGSFDLKLTLEILLEQITRHLKVDACAVLLYKSHRAVLECAAHRGFYKDLIEKTSNRLGEGSAGRAAYERKLVSIDNLNAEDCILRRTRLVQEEKFNSYHCIPLLARGEIKGVLEVFHRSPL